jgi:hypothetical protein
VEGTFRQGWTDRAEPAADQVCHTGVVERVEARDGEACVGEESRVDGRPPGRDDETALRVLGEQLQQRTAEPVDAVRAELLVPASTAWR